MNVFECLKAVPNKKLRAKYARICNVLKFNRSPFDIPIAVNGFGIRLKNVIMVMAINTGHQYVKIGCLFSQSKNFILEFYLF